MKTVVLEWLNDWYAAIDWCDNNLPENSYTLDHLNSNTRILAFHFVKGKDAVMFALKFT